MKEVMDVKIEDDQFKDVYEIASEIGRGKFAVVKECKHRQKDRWYAAKVIRKRRKGVDCRSEVLHEVEMLTVTLSHPHFVDLIEVYETRQEIIIVTELMRGGELFQHITTEGQLDEGYTQNIMRQVLNGLAFLHSQEIAHLDIKPQNILLTDQSLDCKVKLCDLGLARNVNRVDVFEIIGTPDYLAPEILDYQKLSVACDMWSTGVLAYVMLSGYSPFAGDTNQETYLNISQVNLDFPESYFSNVSPLAIQFMQQLLVKDPGCRLKVDESLEHAWMAATGPPSPVEHEPVKRIRFDDDDQLTHQNGPLSCFQKTLEGNNESFCTDSPSIILTHSPISPAVDVVLTERPQQKSEAQIKPKGKKTKEHFKSELNFTPTTPIISLKALSRTTPPSLFIKTPTRSSSRYCIKLRPSNSSSPINITPPMQASKAIHASIENATERLTDHPSIDESKTSLENLSPFSEQAPKLQSSELTPNLSRIKFWKDTSSEPSGIPV